MCRLRKGIRHTSQLDPWETLQVRLLGFKNLSSILTLKVISNKYNSNHETTFSENPMHPFSKKKVHVFHGVLR